MNKQFAQDVERGLSGSPKRLSSKYFYDEAGDKLFQAIMNLPEYYLSRSEYEILEMHREQLLRCFAGSGEAFNLLEFGAGDGFKTKVLLRYFSEKQIPFRYVPVDISGNILRQLAASLQEELPVLEVEPVEDDYFQALKKVKETTGRRSVVLFMGSNIGNFSEEETISFLGKLYENLNKGDLLLTGFDLKKDPDQVRLAYNDSGGITRAFNMNLLKRINEELGGEFNLEKFKHYPMYNPVTGEARSFLMSREKQEVRIKELGRSFSFEAWEPVHVEISRKYDLPSIEEYARRSGFAVVKHFFDCKHYFVDSLWEKK
ncbi:L-histidine N(alpha)-methyltransferase [Nafulsella turpanensis]|uniref:L-histidine N(alpha)-methyltransferase n=1 Tax=Nafulsella turpanensis TaxID=1265690 RepID=UPI0003471947|nr:L-histidine N(alpha)-methyltransferase [Nafulsella turpanensis]